MTNEATVLAFDDFEWHDAILLDLHIDRRAAGDCDEVVLAIEWTDGSRQDLRFTNCYAFYAEMNFGIIALESILEARCVRESPELASLRQKWRKMGVELDDLLSFEITTNSTASSLRVLARGFEVSDRPDRWIPVVKKEPWHPPFVQSLQRLSDADGQRRGWIGREPTDFPSPAELMHEVFHNHALGERLAAGTVFSAEADNLLRAMEPLATKVDVEQSPEHLMIDPTWLELSTLAGRALRAVCDAIAE